MPEVRTVAVIGGGIAGPVTALALHRAGIEATVYERHPSTAAGAGGTIAVAPNGIAALGLVGAGEAAVAAAQPVDTQVLAVGRRRVELPRLSGVGPLHVVRRGELYRILRDLAVAEGVRVEHGKQLIDARGDGTGVTAVFADGSEARADVLVGADGVHSRVRQLIDPAAPGPQYTGMLAFEGLAAMAGDARTMTFAFGRRGYYLYWGTPGSGTTWGVNLPSARGLSLTEARQTPAADWLRTLREVYGDDTPGADLIRTTDPAALQVNGALHIMPKVRHWHRGRMVLVGDAVHAPSNSSGQGASLAAESAVQLARCLRDIPDVPAAFGVYERLRRDRVERVAARAAKINQAKAPGRIGRAIMPVLMPVFVKLAMNPERTIGPEQRYRIDWEAPAV